MAEQTTKPDGGYTAPPRGHPKVLGGDDAGVI
jgi:hypothetical protein